MKYCLNYRPAHTEIMKQADELNIRYNKKDLTLVNFLEEYKDKRINIYIEDIEDFCTNQELKKFEGIRESYPEYSFYFKLSEYNEDLIQELKEKNFKYYISLFVNDWDVFMGLIQEGVSDIYIVENLAFELDKCADIAHENGVNIRIFPNIAQCKWTKSTGLKSFFVRPEDIIQYEPYVDIIEFMCDPSREYVYFDIYKNDKLWYGQLNELISGLDSDIDSRFIVPRFAETRIKCGKACLKGGRCSMCNTIEHLSKTLKDRELMVTMEQIENEPIEEEEFDNIKKL